MFRSISTPNFDKIAQSMAVLLLLLIWENGHPPYWNYTSFQFDLLIIRDIGILLRHAKFEVASSNRYRNMEGVPKFKSSSSDPFATPCPNFAFLSLVPLVMNLHAKFDVSISNRSRDHHHHHHPQISSWCKSWSKLQGCYGGGPKISKIGHVTLSRSVNGGRRWPDIWIPRPRFAYSL